MSDKQVQAIRVEGLDGRVHLLRYGRLVDSFAIVTGEVIVIVDTMNSPETARQIWDLVQGPETPACPVLVINTHGDWDHAWGNGFFDGPSAVIRAPIIGHEAFRRMIDWDRVHGLLGEMRKKEPEEYESVQVRLPTVEISTTATVRAGELTLDLIPTPGHTMDHLAVWIPEVRVLIAGDAAEMPIPFISERSDIAQLRESLNQMASLQPDIVLYSHGCEFYSPDLIAANISYYNECEDRCRSWANEGKDAEPTPESLGWPLTGVMPEVARLHEDQVPFYESNHRKTITAMWNLARAAAV